MNQPKMCQQSPNQIHEKKNTKQKSVLVESWPHYPICLQASGGTKCKGYTKDSPLPIGEPFDFESSLFKGKILVRLRNGKSDNMEKSNSYFSHDRKRILQIVVQGRFKEVLKMSDVYFGDIYKEPLSTMPHPSIVSLVKKLFKVLVPGVMVDLSSKTPKILVLYAGCTKSLSINFPGSEPSMSEVDTPEDTALLGKFSSSKNRKKVLANPRKASKFEFDPKYVYTFHHYDDVKDLVNYELNFPVIGKIDVKKILKTQPMTLNSATGDGRSVFSFDIWHESVWQKGYE